MSVAALTRVGTYEREVGACLERVWENVLDWEHLPWLHRGSFSRIEALAAGAWGWRARVGLQPEAAGEILLELVRDPSAPRYVARTLEGPGRGSEIWTELREEAEERTAIRVAFDLPGVAPERAAALGRSYRALYARLWDEDEAMMQRRADELRRPLRARADGAFDLGPADAVRARLPLVASFGELRFRLLLREGELIAHPVVCPHRLGPLEAAPLDAEGLVRCPWHGYHFDPGSGACRERPGLRLVPRLRVDVEAGRVVVRGA
jgi:nitrite reductase/ring-hydroxylating ferredoxin subunit